MANRALPHWPSPAASSEWLPLGGRHKRVDGKDRANYHTKSQQLRGPMTDPYARYTRLKFDRPHPKILRITMENGRMNTTDAALHAELGDVWRDVDKDPNVNAVI